MSRTSRHSLAALAAAVSLAFGAGHDRRRNQHQRHRHVGHDQRHPAPRAPARPGSATTPWRQQHDRLDRLRHEQLRHRQQRFGELDQQHDRHWLRLDGFRHDRLGGSTGSGTTGVDDIGLDGHRIDRVDQLRLHRHRVDRLDGLGRPREQHRLDRRDDVGRAAVAASTHHHRSGMTSPGTARRGRDRRQRTRAGSRSGTTGSRARSSVDVAPPAALPDRPAPRRTRRPQLIGAITASGLDLDAASGTQRSGAASIVNKGPSGPCLFLSELVSTRVASEPDRRRTAPAPSASRAARRRCRCAARTAGFTTAS